MIKNLRCIACDKDAATMVYENNSIYRVYCDCGYETAFKHSSVWSFATAEKFYNRMLGASQTGDIISTIDIKHGKWLRRRCEETDELISYCSLCGNREVICDDGYVHRQYCSHCGAKMDEEVGDDHISY